MQITRSGAVTTSALAIEVADHIGGSARILFKNFAAERDRAFEAALPRARRATGCPNRLHIHFHGLAASDTTAITREARPVCGTF